MATNPQAITGSDAPLTPSGFRDLAAVIDIFRTLGGIVVLEATVKSHSDKIEQLMQWGSAIPYIEKAAEKNSKDLNELGKRHTTELNDLGQRLDKNVNELEKHQTKNMNEMGIRLGKEMSDLKSNDLVDLKNVAHTAKILGYIALTLAGIIGTVLVTYIYRK